MGSSIAVQRSRTDSGFTLIELMIVISALNLLLMIGVNETQRFVAHARVAQCVAYEHAVEQALWTYRAMNGGFPEDLDAVVGELIRPCWLDGGFEYEITQIEHHEDGDGGEGDDGDDEGEDEGEGDDEGDGDEEGGGGGGFTLRCKHDHHHAGVLFVECASDLAPLAIHDPAEARW